MGGRGAAEVEEGISGHGTPLSSGEVTHCSYSQRPSDLVMMAIINLAFQLERPSTIRLFCFGPGSIVHAIRFGRTNFGPARGCHNVRDAWC